MATIKKTIEGTPIDYAYYDGVLPAYVMDSQERFFYVGEPREAYGGRDARNHITTYNNVDKSTKYSINEFVDLLNAGVLVPTTREKLKEYEDAEERKSTPILNAFNERLEKLSDQTPLLLDATNLANIKVGDALYAPMYFQDKTQLAEKYVIVESVGKDSIEVLALSKAHHEKDATAYIEKLVKKDLLSKKLYKFILKLGNMANLENVTFEVNAMEMWTALDNLQKYVPKNPTMPILEGVLVRLNSNNITLTTFDLSTAIVVNLRAKFNRSFEETSFVIAEPLKMQKLIKQMPDVDLKFSFVSNLVQGDKEVVRLNISFLDKGNYKIAIADAEDYPLVAIDTNPKDNSTATVETKDFLEGLKWLYANIVMPDKTNVRNDRCIAFLQEENNIMQMVVSQGGFIYATYSVNAKYKGDLTDFGINKEEIYKLMDSLSDMPDTSDIKILIQDNRVVFLLDEVASKGISAVSFENNDECAAIKHEKQIADIENSAKIKGKFELKLKELVDILKPLKSGTNAPIQFVFGSNTVQMSYNDKDFGNEYSASILLSESEVFDGDANGRMETYMLKDVLSKTLDSLQKIIKKPVVKGKKTAFSNVRGGEVAITVTNQFWKLQNPENENASLVVAVSLPPDVFEEYKAPPAKKEQPKNLPSAYSLTKDEYVEAYGYDAWVAGKHQEAIIQAIGEGKDVPTNVINSLTEEQQKEVGKAMEAYVQENLPAEEQEEVSEFDIKKAYLNPTKRNNWAEVKVGDYVVVPKKHIVPKIDGFVTEIKSDTLIVDDGGTILIPISIVKRLKNSPAYYLQPQKQEPTPKPTIKEVKEKAGKTDAPKEAWEMTFEEFFSKVTIENKGGKDKNRYNLDIYFSGKKINEDSGYPQPKNKRQYANLDKTVKYSAGLYHFTEIQKALSEGKPVPANVLAEYPELAPPTPAGKTDAPKEAWEMTFEELLSIVQIKEKEIEEYNKHKRVRRGESRMETKNVFVVEWGKDILCVNGIDGTISFEPKNKSKNMPCYSVTKDHAKTRLKLMHQKSVIDALSEGKPVSADVLAEYPELASPAPAGKTDAPKEAWEMTFGEFFSKVTTKRKGGKYRGKYSYAVYFGDKQINTGAGYTEPTTKQQKKDFDNGVKNTAQFYHSEEIEKALSEGKPVPANVLAEYPELTTPTPAGKTDAPKEAWEMTFKEWQIDVLQKERDAVKIHIQTYPNKNWSSRPRNYKIRQKENGGAENTLILIENVLESLLKTGKIDKKYLNDLNSRIPFETYLINHKTYINRAISEGKPVPANVLAEYPELTTPTLAGEASISKARALRLSDLSTKYQIQTNITDMTHPEQLAYLRKAKGKNGPDKVKKEIEAFQQDIKAFEEAGLSEKEIIELETTQKGKDGKPFDNIAFLVRADQKYAEGEPDAKGGAKAENDDEKDDLAFEIGILEKRLSKVSGEEKEDLEFEIKILKKRLSKL